MMRRSVLLGVGDRESARFEGRGGVKSAGEGGCRGHVVSLVSSAPSAIPSSS